MKKKCSKIRFVDLAGSEKVNLETKEIAQEGANINKSLLALTNCINILSSQKAPKSQKVAKTQTFIPYRNSKLTRLLKDSLGGTTPVIMIVCLSPNSTYLEESINSIKYAQKATKIKLGYDRHSSRYFRPTLTNLANFGEISADRAVFNRIGETDRTDRVWLREAYEKRIQDLERECRYWRTVKARKSGDLSFVDFEGKREREEEEGLQEVEEEKFEKEEDVQAEELIGMGEGSIEDEFSELVQALIENVEDENILKQNVLELDELIRKSDEDINEVQVLISESKNPDITSDLYEELKFLADRLEEYLDLKESAIREAEQLKRTINCTKIALRKMFVQRIREARQHQPTPFERPHFTIKQYNNLKSELEAKNLQLEILKTALQNQTPITKDENSDPNLQKTPKLPNPKKVEKSEKIGLGQMLNILMYKFKPKEPARQALTMLDLNKEARSEGKTLVYSDSAREEMPNGTTRRRFNSGTTSNSGKDGLGLISGRGTEETMTNPMSLISSSSRRYFSNDGSLKMV